MTLDELRETLYGEGVSSDTYAIGSWAGPGERFVIEQGQDAWLIYYYERGSRFNEQRFRSEDRACRAFLAWVTRQG